MEEQAEYKVKDRPFHGTYLNQQEKKLRRRESGAIMLGFALAIIGLFLLILMIIGIYHLVTLDFSAL